jgi:hypothetical protein
MVAALAEMDGITPYGKLLEGSVGGPHHDAQLHDRGIGTVSKGVDAGLELVHSRTSDSRR